MCSSPQVPVGPLAALAVSEGHATPALVARGALLLHDLESITERFDVPGGFVEGLQIFLRTILIERNWNDIGSTKLPVRVTPKRHRIHTQRFVTFKNPSLRELA